MRRFNNLTPENRKKAVGKASDRILGAVVEGALRFNDGLNKDTLQADIDTAIQKANDMRTPWFAGEYVWEAVGPMLEAMARCDAEDAFYPHPDEAIIRL